MTQSSLLTVNDDLGIPQLRVGRAGQFVLGAAVLALVFTHSWSVQAQDDAELQLQREFFEQRIRPVLVVECYECHASDVQEAGLRVDWRGGLIEGGDSGPAMVVGNAKESLLWQSIAHQHATLKMPEGRPQLPEVVIQDFAKWIKEGAFDPREAPSENTPAVSDRDFEQIFETRRQASWSLKPITSPLPPEVNDRAWPSSTADRFVLEKLEEAHLRPASEARPETWLRRVHFALTGLAPSETEVLEFVADRSPAARERVVNRLLASPAYGERWARHWMDLVRFAESYGHEQDYEIPYAWRYRDYLIRAFDEDLSYDRFVTEQIAGDVIERPRLDPTGSYNESLVGTGWWFMHQATHGPVDPVQDEADRIDNQIDVLGKTLLGLTLACARCHDHKFDPILMQDYYQLTAFARASRQQLAFLHPDPKFSDEVQKLGPSRDAAHERLLTAIDQKLQVDLDSIIRGWRAAHAVPLEASEQAIAETSATHGLRADELKRWLTVRREALERPLQHPLGRFVVRDSTAGERPQLVAVNPNESEVEEPFAVLDLDDWFASGDAFCAPVEKNLPWSFREGRLDLIPSNALHSGLLHSELQGVLRSPTFKLSQPFLHLRVAGIHARIKLVICRYQLRDANPLLFGETLIDLQTNGFFEWRTLGADIRRYQGMNAYLELIDEGSGFVALDRLVLSSSNRPPWNADSVDNDPKPESDVDAAAMQLAQTAMRGLLSWRSGNDDEAAEAVAARLISDGVWGAELAAAAAKHDDAWWYQSPRPPLRALAITEGTAETTQIFRRGDHRLLGDEVERGFLRAIPVSVDLSEAQGSGRLALADAMTSNDNPLLHRVIVNRVWSHLFGVGIVPTVDDFGAMGRQPTHPELLDHLVTTFRNDQTSIKHLLRRLCLSSSFAMSSDLQNTQAEQVDPENLLLHRQRLVRLEGEAIRDHLFTVAGNLDQQRFGPSVLTHLTPFMGDPFWLNTRSIGSGPMDGNRRRSVYLEIRRNFLNPWMMTFDLPIPDSTVGRRNVSNIPGQALAMMNDPLVISQARVCAQSLLLEHPEDSQARIESLYRRAFSRSALPDEVEHWQRFINGQTALRLAGTPPSADELSVWTDLCHAVLMLKELIYVE